MKAFIGHSFDEEDKPTIRVFKDYFTALGKTMNFSWDDADETDIIGISVKVKEKMLGKQLFIGILTKKQCEIEKNLLSIPKWIHKDKFMGSQKDFYWGTSYWIIQESGYAIGKDMVVLFLIEKDVKKPEGLHSDVEVIFFEKGKESEKFQSIAEGLGNLFNRIEGIRGGVKTEQLPPRPKDEIENQESKDLAGVPVESNKQALSKQGDTNKIAEENSKEMTDEDYIFALITSARKNEEDKFNELKEKILSKYKDNQNKRSEWLAKTLHLRSVFFKENVLDYLKQLHKDNPDNPYIIYCIGYELEKYGNHNEAATEYVKSANLEKKWGDKLHRIHLAAEAYVKDGQRDNALNILLNELRGELPQDEKSIIYGYLADIAKSLKDDMLFTAFSEKTLSLNPSHDSLRFDLASKYDDLNKAALSLFHYKILTNSNPNSSNLNNQGVAYDKLGLPAKEADSFKKASEKGSTTALGNLAQKLLNEGFIEEANEKIRMAMEMDGYEESDIQKPLARLSSIPKQEEEKETKILEDTKEEKLFALEYADGYSIPFVVNDTINGDWQSRHGELSINLESGNILLGQKGANIPEGNFLGIFGLATNPLLGKAAEEKPTFSKRNIYFEGSIVRNRVIKYKMRIEIQPSNVYASKTTNEFSGMGIIDTKLNTIRVIEFDKDNKQTLYKLVKK